MKKKSKLLSFIVWVGVVVFGASACAGSDSEPVAASTTSVAAATTTTTRAPLTQGERLTGLLDEYGFYYSSEDKAVSLAETICDNLGTWDGDVVLAMLVGGSADAETSYTPQDMRNFMSASIAVYCPEHADELG